MDKALFLAAALALAGCAAPAPDTTAMGAGPGCDLSIDVGGDHRCEMSHVSPAQPEYELTNSMRTLQPQAAPQPPRP
jgi:hypothetical protein